MQIWEGPGTGGGLRFDHITPMIGFKKKVLKNIKSFLLFSCRSLVCWASDSDSSCFFVVYSRLETSGTPQFGQHITKLSVESVFVQWHQGVKQQVTKTVYSSGGTLPIRTDNKYTKHRQQTGKTDNKCIHKTQATNSTHIVLVLLNTMRTVCLTTS